LRLLSRPALRVAGACVLAGVAVLGLWWSVRVAVAQALYFQAKYGAARSDTERVLALAERAFQWYPRHYRFCVWAAGAAYRDRLDAEGRERPDRLQAAQAWCARGLALNPHHRELRVLRARLLTRADAAAAAAYWRRYVEWHFWDPWNHALLAKLCADAGEFDAAVDALAWAQREPTPHAEARRHVREAWEAQKRLPAPAGTPPARLPR
jgi:tetratricopeptide (TPR) repeat protein